VTWPEVWDWVERVAKIPRDSWRARYHIEHWNVPQKIRDAKRSSTFQQIYDRP
jgi:hypothetical protein